MCELPDHCVPHDALAATATAPLVRLEDPAGEHRTVGCKPLAGHLKAELVETTERGQISAREPMIRARRDGSVGHVEVFQMDGVGTPIHGRLRRLSAHRRADPADEDHTLNCEEPVRGRGSFRCSSRYGTKVSPCALRIWMAASSC